MVDAAPRPGAREPTEADGPRAPARPALPPLATASAASSHPSDTSPHSSPTLAANAASPPGSPAGAPAGAPSPAPPASPTASSNSTHHPATPEKLYAAAYAAAPGAGPGAELDEMTRQKTRDTILSVRTRHYEDLPEIPTDLGDTAPLGGEEYEELDPELVTWDGAGDPANPRNWRTRDKVVSACLASFFTFVSSMSSSLLSPAVPAIMADFGETNATVGTLWVSIMLLAWAVFVLVMAPMSEVFGRRAVLLTSMAGGLVFQICCAVAPNSAAMLAFRFLGGAFNGAPLAVAAGTIADLFDDQHRTWGMALFGTAPSCGPSVGPLFAGFLVQHKSWHWAFWVGAIVNGAALVLGVFFFRETYAPVILGTRAVRLRKSTGNPNLHTIWEIGREPFARQVRNALLRPVLFLTTHPIVFALGLHMAFVYAFMYLMLITYSSLWVDRYGYSVGMSGVMYLALCLGILTGTVFWTPVIDWRERRRRALGKAKPEDKLFFLPLSTLIMGIALFWYGWSAQAKLMWLMPEIGVFIFGFGLFVVFQAIQTYLVILNTRLASSIIASVALGRTLLGATFPLFGKAMYDRLGYGWANTVIGILMLILGMPAPILIYIHGERIRAWLDKKHSIK